MNNVPFTRGELEQCVKDSIKIADNTGNSLSNVLSSAIARMSSTPREKNEAGYTIESVNQLRAMFNAGVDHMVIWSDIENNSHISYADAKVVQNLIDYAFNRGIAHGRRTP